MDTRFVKEIHVLKRKLDKYTDSQAEFAHVDESDLRNLLVDLSPKRGPYCGGKFRFGIRIPDCYPYVHPQVVCLTEIFHPNIQTDEQGDYNICLNLFNNWSPSFGLLDLINGLLYLLEFPNLSDFISTLFYYYDPGESFLDDVKRSMRGEKFADGSQFDPNDAFVSYERALKESEAANLKQASAPQGNTVDENDSTDSDQFDETGTSRKHSSALNRSWQHSGGQLKITECEESDSGVTCKQTDSNHSECFQPDTLSDGADTANDMRMTMPVNWTSPASNETYAVSAEARDGLAAQRNVQCITDPELSEGEMEAMFDAHAAKGFTFDECAPRFTLSDEQHRRFEYGSSDSLSTEDDVDMLHQLQNECDSDFAETKSSSNSIR